MFLILPGLTLLVTTGSPSDPDKRHYHVVLTSPAEYQDHGPCIVWVSWRSARSKHWDDTCVLGIGDYISIKAKTWVDYSRARIVPVREIEQMQKNGVAIQRDPVGVDVLGRITDGLLASARTPQKVADFYRAAGSSKNS